MNQLQKKEKESRRPDPEGEQGTDPAVGYWERPLAQKLLLVMDGYKVGLREDAHPYLKFRYCSDFISLEKPSKVSIWLSRRCRVVRLLRFSRPSTFFSKF